MRINILKKYFNSALARCGIVFIVMSGIWASGGKAAPGTATLSWQPVTEDTSGHLEAQPVYYNIYCDTLPAFVPGPVNFLAATLAPSFIHTDSRLSDPNRHLFYQVRAVDIWGNQSAVSDTVGEVSYVLAHVRAVLQAPYDAAGDSMKTALLKQGILPLASPYHDAPRAVTQMPQGIVDWVLLQLRDPTTATIVSQESFLLNKAGFLTEPDGIGQTLGLTGCSPGSYQIILRHRNHVAVLSRSSFLFNDAAPTLHDFSADSSFYEGVDAACELENGVWGLWSGDVNQDDLVSELDYGAWQTAARAGKSGYDAADLNFDGRITTSDYVLWYRSHRLDVHSFVP
jgi:hypothetical protein